MKKMRYDYLIVGAGLFGAVFAHEMKKAGKTCLVIEKRDHIAGNVYTKEVNQIQVHKYGAHIFHTSNEEVWNYINQFASFNHYINSPVARYGDELYNLPFNMNTFYAMWGVKTPQEAKRIIEKQKKEANIKEPKNLEEQAISLVGTDVYEKLINGYTMKQWGKECKELPSFIIKRLPLRFTFDNNYFNDRFQGIPVGGYTQIVEKMLEGITVLTNTEYKRFVAKTEDTFDKTVYTGAIDEFFDYCLGELEYRSLRFEEELIVDCENFQGNAVVNYTEGGIPYTRIIEHKHFEFGNQKDTVITKEYPDTWQKGKDSYYPINDEKNTTLYEAYKRLAQERKDLIFGGRLGQYKYYDMDKVVEAALQCVKEQL